MYSFEGCFCSSQWRQLMTVVLVFLSSPILFLFSSFIAVSWVGKKMFNCATTKILTIHCKITTVTAALAAPHISYSFFFWQRHEQNLSERDQAITDLAEKYDFRGTWTNNIIQFTCTLQNLGTMWLLFKVLICVRLWIKNPQRRVIINNYSPKWRWLAVDIYRAAERRGKYPPLATSTSVNSCFSIY